MFDYDVIPRPKAAPQGGLSCPFGAIHLLGISWYCVQICNILPGDCHALTYLAMTEVARNGSFYLSQEIIPPTVVCKVLDVTTYYKKVI